MNNDTEQVMKWEKVTITVSPADLHLLLSGATHYADALDDGLVNTNLLEESSATASRIRGAVERGNVSYLAKHWCGYKPTNKEVVQ